MESENISLETLNEIEEIIKDKSISLQTLQNEIDTLHRIREDISNTLYNDYIVVDSEGATPETVSKTKISKVGVGMLIGKVRNTVSVLAVVKNSTAYNTGIQIKDIITSINEKNINGMTLNDIKNMMIGEEGSTVIIRVLRNNKYITYTVTRMPIPGTEESIFIDIKKSDCIENITDNQETQDTKETQYTKDIKETKDTKDNQETQDTKGIKETKDTKDTKNTKNTPRKGNK